MDWFKSSYSNPNGACVEFASWRKASYSNSQGACIETASFRKSTHSSNPANTCVEAGHGHHVVGVRDTVQAGDPNRTVIEFPARAWREFTARLK